MQFKPIVLKTFAAFIPLFSSAWLFCGGLAHAQQGAKNPALDEITVTAERRIASLQDTPIAISTLESEQLNSLGIHGLDDFAGGSIPSLKVATFTTSTETLIVFIRGLGQADAAQTTKEAAVGVYLDEVYLARAQGLGVELVDFERVEVLRGPQGTLYGRNSTGGAINLVSAKPTGQLGIKQKNSYGRFDQFKQVTHLNLPAAMGVSGKFSYLYSKANGWVDNPAPGEQDFGDEENHAYRAALRFSPIEKLVIDYAYDNSEQKNTVPYFQIGRRGLPNAPIEPNRETTARFGVPLDPTETRVNGHSVTAQWNINDDFSLRSISAYRELDQTLYANYAGALGAGGLIVTQGVDQSQFSQELQLLGDFGRVDFIAGLYWFDESARETELNFSNVDTAGSYLPFPPLRTFSLLGATEPVDRLVKTETESYAIYSQLTYRPTWWDERLAITVGARFTQDDKSGKRLINNGVPDSAVFDTDGASFDPAVTFDVALTNDIRAYLKWSSGYRSGGANIRSVNFSEYNEETLNSYELGWKSEWWGRRVRLNAAAFYTKVDDYQIDFSNPSNVTITETINASNGHVEISGFESDATAIVFAGLTVDVKYSYLDWNLPRQPNPLAGGALERFMLPLSSRHSGAVTVDYAFLANRYGVWSANIHFTSTSRYFFAPKNPESTGRYDLLNARLSLSDIALGGGHQLQVSLWGKNLTDQEYFVYHALAPTGNLVEAYGEPRSYGIDIVYRFDE